MPDTATKSPVTIYTDGACDPNPGIGGWGAIMVAPNGTRKEISGAEPDSTNNRMELTAAISALNALTKPCKVELFTDSEYVMKAFTEGWLKKWEVNGWKTAARKPVKNDDLWRQLLELSRKHEIKWHWVRGHASNPDNNRCDELAVAARIRLRREGHRR